MIFLEVVVVVLEKVISFYDPFVSKNMPRSFWRAEVRFPIIVSLVCGTIGAMPHFLSEHWIVGILFIMGGWFAFYTLQAWMMNALSDVDKDGERFISTSLVTPTIIMVLIASMALTTMIYLFSYGWRFGFEH
jgi:hypothetical protein